MLSPAFESHDGPSGNPPVADLECGYDAPAIAAAVREMMKDKVLVSQLMG